jgi:membrane protease YdiL (CAAX protease family)
MLLFFVIAILALIPIGLVVQIIGYAWDRSRVPWHPDPIALFGLIASLALLVAHWAMLRIDRRSWQFVHLDRGAAKPATLARGWLIGAMTIALPSALLLGVHWLAIRREPPGSWLSAATIVSVGLLPAALWEELLMRGYLFATLREWLGWRTAMLVSSVAFGLMHLSNPGADIQSVTMVFLAGLLLAGVVVATNSLYAAWMAHWAWNWIMAVPLHVAVSGIPMSHPYYETVDAGPDWATGGTWGPEGGAFAGLSILLVIGFAWWRRRGIGDKENETQQ